MIANFFLSGSLLYAGLAPVTIAGSGIVMWPLLGLWFLSLPWLWRTTRPVWGSTEKAFLVFTVIGLLSALHGVDVPHGLRFWSKKDVYFLIVPFLGVWLHTDESRARFARAFLIGGFIAAAWGVAMFFIGVNQTDCHGGTFISLPPQLAHLPRRLLDGLSLVNGRAVGLRCHPLTYAESLLMVLALLLAFLATSGFRRSITLFLSGWLVLAALLFSQSRGPWLAAAVMIILIGVLKPSVKTFARLAIILIPALFFLLQPALVSRAASIMDQKYTSNSERLHMWRVGWIVFKSRPLLGVGAGNVKRVVGPYETPPELVGGPWGHLHNTFINMLVERGSFGAAAFVAWLLILGWEFVAALRQPVLSDGRRAWIFAGLLALAGFLVSGLTETVYNDEALLFAFYAVIGAALAAARAR